MTVFGYLTTMINARAGFREFKGDKSYHLMGLHNLPAQRPVKSGLDHR